MKHLILSSLMSMYYLATSQCSIMWLKVVSIYSGGGQTSFFYTVKDNTEAINRTSLGFKRAWEHGGFIRLWRDEYCKNIDFLNLKFRFLNRYPQHIKTRQGLSKIFSRSF